MADHFPHDVGCFSPPICGCVISEIERERAARAQAEAERDEARARVRALEEALRGLRDHIAPPGKRGGGCCRDGEECDYLEDADAALAPPSPGSEAAGKER